MTNEVVSYANPLHEVRDQQKYLDIMQSMESNGWQGRPILVVDCGDCFHALTGSHRIAAAEALELDIPVAILDVEEFCNDYDYTLDDITSNLEFFCSAIAEYDKSASELLLQDLN